ncbi:MAG: YwqG family protein [Myxococcaceae bacterium]
MTRDEAVQEIRRSDFAGDSPRVERVLRPQIELVRSLDPGRVLTPGASRLGGLPDVPAGFEWPHRGDRPLQFLAQLDLEAIRQVGPDPSLPSSGSLLFFYDAVSEPTGFLPEDRDGWRVLLVGADDLQRARAPEDLHVFPAHALTLRARQALPDSWDDAFPLPLNTMGDEEILEWEALRSRIGSTAEVRHHLLGWPDLIQGDMKLTCQLASAGVRLRGPMDYRTPQAYALSSGAADWRLLLQLDSDEQLDWTWATSGRLYFWIRDQDLRSGDFSGTWAVLQWS